MAQIFLVPSFQSIAATGTPHAGGKLYFYQTATTTPITVYQDEGATTPHTHPVVADSAGRFPAIYVSQTSPYKIVLTDAADVTITTIDPVNGQIDISSILADIAALQADVAELQADVVALDSRIDSVEAQVADFTDDLDGLNDLTRTLYTGAGTYAIDTEAYGTVHVARTTGNVTWNLGGLSLNKSYWFAADYNSGIVLLDASPGYYWRNTTSRDGSVDTTIQAMRLRPGDVARVWRLTTNEFWVIGGFARPSYVPLNTNGQDGYIERGPNGTYHGVWRRTLNGSGTNGGLTVLDFSTIYVGAPAFTGANTIVTGITCAQNVPVAMQCSWDVADNGAGTVTITNGSATSMSAMIAFDNLRL